MNIKNCPHLSELLSLCLREQEGKVSFLEENTEVIVSEILGIEAERFAANQEITDLEKRIAELETELTEIGKHVESLEAAIY